TNQTCHTLSGHHPSNFTESFSSKLHYSFLLIDPLQAALMNGRPSVFTSQTDHPPSTDHLWKAASP
ncbi:hypothetical protein LY76DRAFT_520421, partial [Colletotrichum caudatum]